jgi:citrate lyase subunit beta/citryl-CoA lyase
MYSRTTRMRSKLFVPGSRPELFAKALATEADAISVDLEDSVPEERKGEARARAAAFLGSAEAAASGKTIVVRVNAPGTPHFEADLAAIARPGLALVNLPKVESAEALRDAIAALHSAEASNRVAVPIGVLVTIETPAGLRQAAEIAGAHARVAGLQVGYLDLFEPQGIDRGDAAAVHAVLFAVRLAAAEAGVAAYDGAFADVKDAEGFRREAAMARRLGFSGKSCIHPSQVAFANAVFQPSADEIARAERIVTAAGEARAAGNAVFLLDGRMVDAPAIRRAQAVLARAGKTGKR